MRLKSGTLYWPTTCSPDLHVERLQSDLRCDVLVVGAGITGAMAAERLAASGARVIVIDRRPVATGSTPASTALVLYEIDVPLIGLKERLGSRGACQAYRASYEAVRQLQNLVARLDDPCELQQRPSLYMARTARDAERCRLEAEARRRIGIGARFLESASLEARYGFRRPGAIESNRAFEVNPLRLTYALLRSAIQHGARVVENVHVDHYEPGSRGCPVKVRAGRRTITADWVIIATGYEAPEQFALVAQLTQLKSTFAITTSRFVDDPWPRRAMFWETGDPYLYGRATADRRLLFGGLDIRTSDPKRRDRLIPAKSRALASALHKLVPTLHFRVEYQWAGTFAQTADGLPYIGAHRNWPHVLFALGYGGNGLTFSTIAAHLVTDAVRGRSNSSAKLFGFDRASE